MFQWCSGVRMRFKKTEVCQTCSKLKNVCLTCLLGLEYGLPIQIQNSDGMRPVGLPGRAPGHNDMLLKLTRNMPYYKRIRLHICSICMKGVCKRGEKCLYWNHFYQFGESHTITLVQRQQCTFIQFTTQHATEHAPGKSFNRLIINGCRLTVR